MIGLPPGSGEPCSDRQRNLRMRIPNATYGRDLHGFDAVATEPLLVVVLEPSTECFAGSSLLKSPDIKATSGADSTIPFLNGVPRTAGTRTDAPLFDTLVRAEGASRSLYVTPAEATAPPPIRTASGPLIVSVSIRFHSFPPIKSRIALFRAASTSAFTFA